MPSKLAEYRDIGGRASVFEYIVVFTGAGAILNASDNQALAQARAVATSDEHQK